jgi:hypothetical protein
VSESTDCVKRKASTLQIVALVLASGSGCGRENGLAATGADGRASEGLDASAALDSNPAETQRGGWTNRTAGTSASGQEWLAATSDASGQRLVAVSSTVTSPGDLVSGCWASTDGGSTWAHVGDRNGHASVASNATGTVFIAAGGRVGIGGDEPVWELTSSGAAKSDVTWALMPLAVNASSVASDATGTHFVAGSEDGIIWTSADSGANWTNQTPAGPAHEQNWISVASSSTGTKLVALSGGARTNGCPGYCPSLGDIWTSHDSGATWIDRTPTGPAHDARWTSVASDASGMNLVAVGSGIWTSSDAGLTWTQQTAPPDVSSNDVWASVASDATGQRLIAATYGDPGTGGSAGSGGGFRPARHGSIFTSTDAGVTWTNETAGTAAANQNWVGVASDSSGVHFVAIADFGDVWTK